MKARGQKENFGDAGASEEGSERKAKDEQLVCVFECIIFQPDTDMLIITYADTNTDTDKKKTNSPIPIPIPI